jgi:hypothetical protein
MCLSELAHAQPQALGVSRDKGDVVLKITLCPADSHNCMAQKKEGLDLPKLCDSGTVLKSDVVQEKDAKPATATDLLSNPCRVQIYLKPFRYSPLTCRTSGRYGNSSPLVF